MSEKTNFAVLQKINGLSKIEFHRNPVEYSGKNKHDDDPEIIGEYKLEILPGARTGLSIDWDNNNDQYCWGGTKADLHLIVKELKWRYPVDHPYSSGQLIKGEDVDLKNYTDAFFNIAMSHRIFMEGGRKILDLDKPLERLLYFSYKANPKVKVQGVERADIFTAGAQFELIEPKQDKSNTRKEIDNDIDALILLKGMSYERQLLMAKALNLKHVDLDGPDPDLLFIELKKQFASNDTILVGYSKTHQERFQEIGKLSDEELKIMADVMTGLRYRVITKAIGGYAFNMAKIDVVKTENDLINYFRSDLNASEYVELLEKISEKQQHINGKGK